MALRMAGRVRRARLGPRGSKLATYAEDNSLVIWDVATHTMISSICETGLKVNDIRFAPDDLTFAAACGGHPVTR